MYDSAVWIVRMYYIVNLYMVYDQLAGIRARGLSGATLDPVWPLIWVEQVGLELGSLTILYFSIAAGFVGVLFWQYRSARVVVALSQLFVAGFVNSFGGIGHSLHEWLWIGVCFVFLPTGPLSETGGTRAGRFTFLTVFSLAQGLILLFYSLSGLYKVSAALQALLAGEVGGFSLEAMALTLANRMLQSNTDAVWAPFIIENDWLGWPLYVGLYYVEFVSIVILFRPSLHRIWGFILIAFHFGTFLFMEIPFPDHVLINAMLFVYSPFRPDKTSWASALQQLPIFGVLARRLIRHPPLPVTFVVR